MLLPVLKDPQQAAVGHWTDVKVHGWLQQQFQIELSYSTMVRYLHDQNLHLRVAAPHCCRGSMNPSAKSNARHSRKRSGNSLKTLR